MLRLLARLIRAATAPTPKALTKQEVRTAHRAACQVRLDRRIEQ